jgi:hypothetical protein
MQDRSPLSQRRFLQRTGDVRLDGLERIGDRRFGLRRANLTGHAGFEFPPDFQRAILDQIVGCVDEVRLVDLDAFGRLRQRQAIGERHLDIFDLAARRTDEWHVPVLQSLTQHRFAGPCEDVHAARDGKGLAGSYIDVRVER